MDIVFYKFTKKGNSTSRPRGGGFGISGILNENTSIISPSLSIKFGVDITGYNYAYIPDFQRFYKVVSWTYALGLWRCDLYVDVLASFKPEIGDMNAYILRSASQNDGNIIDGLYPTTPKTGILESTAESVFNANDFIIHYVGKEGLKAVLISRNAMVTLCKSLWNTWSNIEGMSDAFAAIADPFQYVSAIQKTYAPIGFWGGQGATNIVLGTVDTGAAGQEVTDREGKATIALSVPKHPQSGDRPYLKASPYSVYSARLPGIGWISIPSDALYNASAVSVKYYGEPSSGNLRADICIGDTVIASGTGKINTDWGIAGASSSTGVGGIVGKMANGAGALLGGIMGEFTKFIGAGAGIVDGVASATAMVQQNGGASGCVGMMDPLILQLKYQVAVTDNVEDHGRPLMAFRDINTLSGFVLCEGAHFEGVCTQTERTMIDDALNGGFFYE